MTGCDDVYYCVVDARGWLTDPAPLYRTNVDGTRNVLAVACAVHASHPLRRFVFTSASHRRAKTIPLAMSHALATAGTVKATLKRTDERLSLGSLRLMRAEGPLDHGKAVRELGWHPRPVEESIAEAARFWVGLRAAEVRPNSRPRPPRTEPARASIRVAVMTRLIALGFATLLFVTACSSGNVTTTSSSTEAAPASVATTPATTTPAAGLTITIGDFNFGDPPPTRPGATVTVIRTPTAPSTPSPPTRAAHNAEVSGKGTTPSPHSTCSGNLRLPLHLPPDEMHGRPVR